MEEMNTTANSSAVNTSEDLYFDPKIFSRNSSEEGYALYFAYAIYYIIIDSVLFLPTVLGNSLVLLAIWRFKSLRSCNSYILIGNLAVSDLLLGLIIIPTDIALLVSDIGTHSIVCSIYFCLLYSLMGASVINIFVMSLERSHALVRPLHHKTQFTRRRVYMLIALTWICVISMGFFPMILRNDSMFEESENCRYDFISLPVYGYVVSLFFVITFTTNLVFFIIIVRIALSKVKSAATSQAPGNATTAKRDLRHTKLMLFVSGLFFICWAPFFIMALVPDASDNFKLARNWMYSFGFINACLNWIVYGYRNRKFREAFKLILRCSNKRGEFTIYSTST